MQWFESILHRTGSQCSLICTGVMSSCDIQQNLQHCDSNCSLWVTGAQDGQYLSSLEWHLKIKWKDKLSI